MNPEDVKKVFDAWQHAISIAITTRHWAAKLNTREHKKFLSHTTRDESTVIFTSGPLGGQILILS